MAPAAAIPPPGMLMSSRHTAGRSCRASSTAASALAASPHTSKPSPSSTVRIPARVGAWSSAMTMRIGALTAGAPRCSVPPPASEESLKRPPSASARSRMLTSPKPPTRVCLGSKPEPSSAIRSSVPCPFVSSTETFSAPPWRPAFVIASRTMRMRASRSSGETSAPSRDLDTELDADAARDLLGRLDESDFERLVHRSRQGRDCAPGLVQRAFGGRGERSARLRDDVGFGWPFVSPA